MKLIKSVDLLIMTIFTRVHLNIKFSNKIDSSNYRIIFKMLFFFYIKLYFSKSQLYIKHQIMLFCLLPLLLMKVLVCVLMNLFRNLSKCHRLFTKRSLFIYEWENISFNAMMFLFHQYQIMIYMLLLLKRCKYRRL